MIQYSRCITTPSQVALVEHSWCRDWTWLERDSRLSWPFLREPQPTTTLVTVVLSGGPAVLLGRHLHLHVHSGHHRRHACSLLLLGLGGGGRSAVFKGQINPTGLRWTQQVVASSGSRCAARPPPLRLQGPAPLPPPSPCSLPAYGCAAHRNMPIGICGHFQTLCDTRHSEGSIVTP